MRATFVLKSLKKALLLRVELWIVAILLSLATLGFDAFTGLYRSQADLGWRGKWRSGISGGGGGYLVVARQGPRPENAAEQVGATRFLPVVVEIIDLKQWKIVHSWKPLPGHRLRRFNVLPDGSLVADGWTWTPTFRMDSCSNVMWERHLDTHHSFERDVDGNFWSPWRLPRSQPPSISWATPAFREDGVVSFSPAGEVLARITLADALIRAGHGHLVFGLAARSVGNFHMNDVEPVLQDGPFWRRGDLFVSLRNSSAVLLYRPATDEVLWLQAGPWLQQHDVDVVSGSEISVYSNNAVLDDDDPWVLGANEVYVHDFATGETRSPWREVMRRHDVRTPRSGGATVFADGSLMVEESHQGRILMLSPNGERVWSYVNRASDGVVYMINASRWLDAEYGAQVVRSIASLDCEPDQDSPACAFSSCG